MSYQSTLEEALALQLAQFRGTPRDQRVARLSNVAGGVLVAVLFGWVTLTLVGRNHPHPWLPVATLLGVSGVVLLTRRLTRPGAEHMRELRKYHQRRFDLLRERGEDSTSCELADDGLVVTTEAHESRLLWPTIREIFVAKELLLVVSQPRQQWLMRRRRWLGIPLRAFPDEAVRRAFTDELQRRSPRARVSPELRRGRRAD